jgi:fumarate hydratase class II
MAYREEKDAMGTVRVPEGAYYGSQTRRAIDNFPVSGLTFPPGFIHALALIKKCAAETSAELVLLETRLAGPIATAAREVQEGLHDSQFTIDVFQTGSGTSTNMNMNEVIATRANEIVTGRKQGRSPVHPNDHVNLGQSSNDVIPTAIHLAAFTGLRSVLLPGLERLETDLRARAEEFRGVRKIGRTHLQDAVPIFLGDEFSGYARQAALGRERVAAVEPRLAELALGGTAVGNGLNAHPQFAAKVIERISRESGVVFREARDHFEAQAARDAAVEVSGALKTIAVGMVKIANDLRWLASGPRCGIGEINLPALQPGSSIMPGKVNPVIPEAVLQVAAQVMGNDLTITLGGQGGAFELNTMMPVIAYNLLQSIEILGRAAAHLGGKCVAGITANREKASAYIEQSLALVTSLTPRIGYDRAAQIAHRAYRSGKTIRQVAAAEGVLTEEELNRVLGPA